MWVQDSILEPWQSCVVLALSISETLNQSASLPQSPQHKPCGPHVLTATSLLVPPRLGCHTDLQLRCNICSHSSPMSPSPPSAGYRWSSQALTWATTNLFMVSYRRVGVLIQTAETTLTAQPTMEDHGGCRGMPRDTQDGAYLNLWPKYYCVQVQVCYCHSAFR